MDDDPTTGILAATYRALCPRGSAGLTIAEVTATGVGAGNFAEQIGPGVVARDSAATATEAHTRRAAFDRSAEQLYETLVRYAEEHLLTDELAEVSGR